MCIRDRRLLSQKPAEIGRLEGHPASLEVDQVADLVLIDPGASSVFSVADLKGMSHNSPFLDMELPGRVAYTVPVSYTHLDVYKRQPEVFELLLVFDGQALAELDEVAALSLIHI